MNAEWLIVMGDESRVIIVDWMMTGNGWWVMSYIDECWLINSDERWVLIDEWLVMSDWWRGMGDEWWVIDGNVCWVLGCNWLLVDYWWYWFMRDHL